MIDRREGRAWVFGDDVSTDDILPGRYLQCSNDEVGRHVMAGIDPTLAERMRTGDILVGGRNFGCGSGRESAPYAIANAGFAAVVAPSFGRVFFRNCINIGLPTIMVDRVDGIASGDPLSIDMVGRCVTNGATGVTYLIRNLTGISLEILRAGGIVPYTVQRIARQREEGRWSRPR
jgi:3-isopropylmalate/(R)-2-methylmalate dehydratase small subunit